MKAKYAAKIRKAILVGRQDGRALAYNKVFSAYVMADNYARPGSLSNRAYFVSFLDARVVRMNEDRDRDRG